MTFFDKRQYLKARIHETDGIFVDLIVRLHSNQQMNTFRRFKMLALRTMAGDELKDGVNNATSSLKRSSMTFCMCVCLYDRNQLCIEH